MLPNRAISLELVYACFPAHTLLLCVVPLASSTLPLCDPFLLLVQAARSDERAIECSGVGFSVGNKAVLGSPCVLATASVGCCLPIQARIDYIKTQIYTLGMARALQFCYFFLSHTCKPLNEIDVPYVWSNELHVPWAA